MPFNPVRNALTSGWVNRYPDIAADTPDKALAIGGGVVDAVHTWLHRTTAGHA